MDRKFRVMRFACGHFKSVWGKYEYHEDDYADYPHFSIWLANYDELNNKRAFATLRKEIKEYRHNSPIWCIDRDHSETGDLWILHQETLFHFADRFEFESPLETLIAEALVNCKKSLR